MEEQRPLKPSGVGSSPSTSAIERSYVEIILWSNRLNIMYWGRWHPFRNWKDLLFVVDHGRRHGMLTVYRNHWDVV